MEFAKLKAFIVVAEELNFRRSAELLGMSQPPLTRLIASLEEELGTQLFDRTTRQVRLTGAGVVLLKEAREIVSAIARIETEIRSIGKMKRGALNIGFSATVFLARFPTIIDEFKNRFPKVKMDLHQESSREILNRLKDGHFDVGFVENITSEKDLNSYLVQDEVLGVLLPKKHPLIKKKEIEFEDLKDETIILHQRSESKEFYDRISRLLSDLKEKPKVYIKAERESCPILVATGKGVSLTIAGTQNIVMNQTRFVPIKNMFLPVSVFWKPENTNPSLNCFLSFAKENRSLKIQKAECLTDVMT
jgi:DNA-binding transcriptional LysR family regulator